MRRETEPFDHQWKALAFTLAAIFSGLLIYTAFQLISPIRGEWQGTIQDDQVCITFERNGWLRESHRAQTCFSWHEFSVLPIRHRGTFELYRPPGMVRLSGSFSDKAGRGSFEFIPRPDQAAHTSGKCGQINTTEEALFKAFLHHSRAQRGQQACHRRCHRHGGDTTIF